MQIDAYPADTVEVRLPVWTPGSYLIREFARNLDGLTAEQEGRAVVAVKTEKNAWKIAKAADAPLTVRYRVYSKEYSVRTSYIDEEQAVLMGTTYLLFVPGLLAARHELQIKPAAGWKDIATALPMVGQNKWHRYAAHYDDLVDAPIQIGNFSQFMFEAAGVKHIVAMPGQDKYPEKRLKRDMAKIVEASTAIFDHQPNEEYVFIVQHSAQGGGGLEHKSSTTLQTRNEVYEKESSYEGFMGLVAHEYFHLWNVKRLRPIALGPFDYDRENYTHNLWFSEGFTSYYDNLLLARTRLQSEEDYLAVLSNGFNATLGNRGDAVQSLAESSLESWIKFYLRNENSGNIADSTFKKI
jgi:predicted metalloprotease with PDZ domain